MSKNPLHAAVILLLLSFNLFSEVTVRIKPEILYPGDAFLIEIESSVLPSGKFDGKSLTFYKASKNNLYYAISFVRSDIKPGIYYLYVSAGKTSVGHIINVHKKTFPVQRITLPSWLVFLSPEDLKRVKKENLKLSSLWSEVTELMWEGSFIPPLDEPVSTPFGILRIINKELKSVHKGVDYKANPDRAVSAINSGVVVLTDELLFPGRTVMINHGGGIYSLYMHLSDFAVKEGNKVKKGETIGYVGSTGRATGPHLHLTVKIHGTSINPESLFALPIP